MKVLKKAATVPVAKHAACLIHIFFLLFSGNAAFRNVAVIVLLEVRFTVFTKSG